MLVLAGILLMALIAAVVLTGLLRRYAVAFHLLDIPNARSSHQIPTPRGGGLAIVIVFLSGLSVFAIMGLPAAKTAWVFCSAGAGVALVGFLDDHRHLPARQRLWAHFVAAAWGLYGLGGMPPLLLFGHSIDLGWAGQIIGLFYLVWLLNLYNFMDGIDGLAGIEAITVCLGGVLLALSSPENSGQHWMLALLGMTVAGFMVWNFPPARIFMGDAGSGFLGIMLGLFSIQAASVAAQFFWSWLILLGVFIVDATWTLMRRFLSGEKVYEAHRSHAYQYASRHYGAHKPVTLVVAMINLCWLTPLALWVGTGGLDGLSGLLLAYLPLVLLAVSFKAGIRETV
ncbi:MAG: glycosyltransferase family 4 protein [Methylovulum sp.]|nr:glycosyltransferase family 4 protein [Methylovulum sp.]